jgi:hypothetical protein
MPAMFERTYEKRHEDAQQEHERNNAARCKAEPERIVGLYERICVQGCIKGKEYNKKNAHGIPGSPFTLFTMGTIAAR